MRKIIKHKKQSIQTEPSEAHIASSCACFQCTCGVCKCSYRTPTKKLRIPLSTYEEQYVSKSTQQDKEFNSNMWGYQSQNKYLFRSNRIQPPINTNPLQPIKYEDTYKISEIFNFKDDWQSTQQQDYKKQPLLKQNVLMKPRPNLNVVKLPSRYKQSNYSIQYSPPHKDDEKFPNYQELRCKPNLTLQQISFNDQSLYQRDFSPQTISQVESSKREDTLKILTILQNYNHFQSTFKASYTKKEASRCLAREELIRDKVKHLNKIDTHYY